MPEKVNVQLGRLIELLAISGDLNEVESIRSWNIGPRTEGWYDEDWSVDEKEFRVKRGNRWVRITVYAYFDDGKREFRGNSIGPISPLRLSAAVATLQKIAGNSELTTYYDSKEESGGVVTDRGLVVLFGSGTGKRKNRLDVTKIINDVGLYSSQTGVRATANLLSMSWPELDIAESGLEGADGRGAGKNGFKYWRKKYSIRNLSEARIKNKVP